jgi:hypothetical protein
MRIRYDLVGHNQYIPFHEFVKTVGLFNRLYYSHTQSNIKNIFYPETKSSDHFLKFWIMCFLTKRVETSGRAEKFIPVSEIEKYFNSFGYNLKDIQVESERLFKDGLVESNQVSSDIEAVSKLTDLDIAITSKGFYYLKELVPSFPYLDLVCQDTPIRDEECFSKIYGSFPKSNDNGYRDLYKRLSTVEEFINYLGLQELKQPRTLIKTYGSIVEMIRSGNYNSDKHRIQKVLNNK